MNRHHPGIAVQTVIGDLLALRETGLVCRPVAELDVAVAAWRTAIRDTARSNGIRVRTFLIPPTRIAPTRGRPTGGRPRRPPVQMVCAVRTDVAADGPGARTDPLWWRRVDDLPVPVATWRAVLRRTAHRENAALRTFLIPPTSDELDPTGQLVYAVWIAPSRGPSGRSPHGHRPSQPTPRPRAPMTSRDPTEPPRPRATTDIGAR